MSDRVTDRRPRRGRYGWLGWLGLLVAAAVALPLFTIVYLAATPQDNIWPHLIRTVLPGYIWRTLVLLVSVGGLTAIIGTGTAWLCAKHHFPFRRFYKWASLLPLAMPVYITSYTYVAFFNYSGPVQTALRSWFGWQNRQDYWFPEIRSLPGAVIVLSAVLYPYVFMTAQAAFLRMPMSQIEAARSLGRSPTAAFFRVALPQTWPAIAVGVSLVMMEILNDVAAVNFFGVTTLTLGIFNTLQINGNLAGAAQLSLILLLFVFALLGLERYAASSGRKPPQAVGTRLTRRLHLRGWRGWLASLVTGVPILAGFCLPTGILLHFAYHRFTTLDFATYLKAIGHSLVLASTASVIVLALGLLIAYAVRQNPKQLGAFLWFATLGYAVPGTILGIGILVPAAGFDNAFHTFMMQHFGIGTGLLLSGSMAALVYAYAIRFLAISHGALQAGLARITPNINDAARILGRTPAQTVWAVHVPMLRPALVSAALLVFVDCMKELPATLILRPFDFETLSTLVFNQASLDMLEESALPALTIVAAGIIPVMVLARSLRGNWLKA